MAKKQCNPSVFWGSEVLDEHTEKKNIAPVVLLVTDIITYYNIVAMLIKCLQFLVVQCCLECETLESLSTGHN